MRSALRCLFAFSLAVLPALRAPADSPPLGEQKPLPQEKTLRLDNYGDPLPEGAVARFGTVRLRNCGSPVFSPDGKYLVTSAGDAGSDVVFWDSQTGKEMRRLSATVPIHHLHFSPDGRFLAGMRGTHSRMWEVATGLEYFTFHAHQGTFTSDGRHVIGVDANAAGDVIGMWDVANGHQVRKWTLPAETSDADAICCSPDGKTVVYAVNDRVILYDLEKKAEKRRWALAGRVLLSFSPDGTRLAVAGRMGVRLWEIAGGTEVSSWEQRADSVPVFSADGKRLAWTSDDEQSGARYPWIVDVGQAKPRRLGLPANDFFGHPAFSPDGKLLAVSTDAGVELRDIATGKDTLPFDGHPSRVNDLALSPDGRHLVTFDSWRVLVWDKATVKLLRRFPEDLPSGEVVLATTVAAGKILTLRAADDSLRVRDLTTGRELLRLASPPGFVDGDNVRTAVTTDGKSAAILGKTGIRLLDLTTGKSSLIYRPVLAVWGVLFSADGQLLLITLQDPKKGLVHVHVDTRTAREVDHDKLPAADFTWPGGNWSEFWTERVPKLQKLGLKDAQGKPAFEAFEWSLFEVVESRGGRYLAVHISERRPDVIDESAKSYWRFWDKTTGLPIDHIQLPDGHRFISFSPDNRLLVTISSQATIHLWDLVTGQERLHFRGHLVGSFVPEAAILFTPDHRFLISGGDDSQVLLWDLTTRAPDGVWRTVQHDAQKRLDLWDKLAGPDSAVAHQAIWELAADPAGTVAFLETKLKPVAAPADNEIARLIGELDSEVFAKRQAAQALLTKIGDQAVPAIGEALAKPRTLEQRLRLQKLFQELGSPRLTGDHLRGFRALEILERIATSDARRLLDNLAHGSAASLFTRAAKESLERLPTP